MTSTCRSVLRELARWADAHPDQVPLVDPAAHAHLAECSGCASRVARARTVSQALRALPPAVPAALPGAHELLQRTLPVARQEALGRSLAQALPRLALPDGAIARPLRKLQEDPAPAEPVLRVGLRTPMPTPGWLWTRVRSDLRALRGAHQDGAARPAAPSLGVASVAQAAFERSLQRWLHLGLASAAALVLALWSSSTLQAKIADVDEPVVLHQEAVPLELSQMPEAIHEEVQELTSRPVREGGR